MTAWRNPRSRRLPSNWRGIRKRVLYRDGFTCQIADPMKCVGWADEVDHIEAGDDHSMGNLRAVCGPCHSVKSKSEAKAAREAALARGYRPAEPHPGAI